MRKILNAWLFALVMGNLLMLSGCSKELTFYPPEIQYEGLTLTSSNNGVNYTGEIPQEGAEFVIECAKPITGIRIERGKNVVSSENWNPSISGGYWGEIIRESENRYKFKINSNGSGIDRNFVFTFGSGFEICVVTLLQSSQP